MPDRFPQPPPVQSAICQTAHDVLGQAAHACQSFHNLFNASRTGAGRGTTTDAEQDTLRAMLVFACAGLHSALKQLVRDALPSVIDRDPGAHTNFTKSVERKLPDIERSRDLLASVLTAYNPRQHLLARLMDDLQADSLQSVGQLSKIAAAFNIKSSELGDMRILKEAFEARNQIIHEMDINFSATRSRRQRKKQDMERLTETVLTFASSLLLKVDGKLRD
jgi:2-polyprenyl-6-methoxyphenol hydroxylase-like FAD-dependent oxidoreductase